MGVIGVDIDRVDVLLPPSHNVSGTKYPVVIILY